GGRNGPRREPRVRRYETALCRAQHVKPIAGRGEQRTTGAPVEPTHTLRQSQRWRARLAVAETQQPHAAGCIPNRKHIGTESQRTDTGVEPHVEHATAVLDADEHHPADSVAHGERSAIGREYERLD